MMVDLSLPTGPPMFEVVRDPVDGLLKLPVRLVTQPPVAMTMREQLLLLNAAIWYKAYDDANPDVGMGPGWRQIVDSVCGQLAFEVSEADRNTVATWLAERVQT